MEHNNEGENLEEPCSQTSQSSGAGDWSLTRKPTLNNNFKKSNFYLT